MSLCIGWLWQAEATQETHMGHAAICAKRRLAATTLTLLVTVRVRILLPAAHLLARGRRLVTQRLRGERRDQETRI